MPSNKTLALREVIGAVSKASEVVSKASEVVSKTSGIVWKTSATAFATSPMAHRGASIGLEDDDDRLGGR